MRDRFSYSASWEDYDQDGDSDLFVANDFGKNCLYRNDSDKGVFTNVTKELGLETSSFSMGVAWGDANRDGRPDLYVSNMFSAAGNRIAFQKQFMPHATSNSRKSLQFTSQGNVLYIQKEDGTFENQVYSSGTRQGRWSWGARFIDANGDGWEDIYVPNGFVSSEKSAPDL